MKYLKLFTFSLAILLVIAHICFWLVCSNFYPTNFNELDKLIYYFVLFYCFSNAFLFSLYKYAKDNDY